MLQGERRRHGDRQPEHGRSKAGRQLAHLFGVNCHVSRVVADGHAELHLDLLLLLCSGQPREEMGLQRRAEQDEGRWGGRRPV